jgi:response regulator RpfG family c-di-GMP phosphodiesterase
MTMKKHERQTILFIDDEPSWLEAMKNVFKKEMFTVITAQSGEDAISKLHKRKPDLILSDVRMPVMNGFDLYVKVKENPSLASIPFFFMSSIDDYDAKEVARELGATGYFEKPYDTREVTSLVNKLLERIKK